MGSFGDPIIAIAAIARADVSAARRDFKANRRDIAAPPIILMWPVPACPGRRHEPFRTPIVADHHDDDDPTTDSPRQRTLSPGRRGGGHVVGCAGDLLLARPVSRIIASAPHAGIGFIEAHGLALIIGVLLWRAPPVRAWHLTGAAVHVLLGISNLVFWQFFVAADMLWVGYLTTSLHGLFVVLQLLAARAAGPGASAHSSLRSAWHCLHVMAGRRHGEYGADIFRGLIAMGIWVLC
jgi:hypothetical protein